MKTSKKPTFTAAARQVERMAKTAPPKAVEILIDNLRETLRSGKDAPQGSYVQELVACGKARCKSCQGGKVPSHGPYWCYYFVENHKTRKKYIGKELPPGVTPPQSSADSHTP